MESALSVQSVYSLVAVVGVLALSRASATWGLSKNATQRDVFVFTWLAFDALIHFTFEGSFLWYSVFGRTALTSEGPLAALWHEYAKADSRWGVADPTVVALELLTVLGAGPLACYILVLLAKNDPMQHYWIIVISTAELYGGFMTFCPEWLVGSPSLNTSNPLYLYIYLWLMNGIWIIIPVWLMFDSYQYISTNLQKRALSNKRLE